MRAGFTHLIGPDKGRCDKFETDIITVGRAPNNHLSFGDAARRVSSHHAEIIRRGNTYLLRDLGSTNGTMINGRRVVVSELHHDDMIEFGAGGPLVRFAIERDAAKPADESSASAASAQQPGFSIAARIVPTSARSRKANVLLMTAVALAMLIGAFGGVVLSSRLGASEEGRLSFSEIAELNSPAVVFIRAEYELIDSFGRATPMAARTGSGFIVSQSGLIVTNRHLIRDWEYNSGLSGANGRVTKIEVFFPQHSRAEAIPAQVERLSAGKEIDVAILKIAPERLSTVHGVEPDLNLINQGDDVSVMGYPLGLELLDLTNDETVAPSLSTGVVSRIGQGLIQLHLRAYRGSSGGPVLNRKGQVIGIITANVGSAQDITLATPIGAALELIKAR